MARPIFHLLVLQLVFVGTTLALFRSASSKIKDGNKYQLQQKVLTLGTSYTITDDHNKPVYKVTFYFYSIMIYTK